MKSCKCNGNNSLRSAGVIRCECGGELTMPQILHRIIDRLNELDERDSNLIQGLVEAGLGECDRCGDWFKESELLRAGDRVTCERCFSPDHFIRESDDEESLAFMLPRFMGAVIGGRFNAYHAKPYLDLLPKDSMGKLVEPFLTEYRKRARQ